MNRFNKESLRRQLRDKVASIKSRVVGATTALMTLPGMVMAQEATFDTASITTKITTYAGYALVILLAFAAAVWGLRAAGLIGKR